MHHDAWRSCSIACRRKHLVNPQGMTERVCVQFKEATVPILGVSALIALASFIPIVRGTKTFDDGGGEGIKPFRFNVTNELINGRAACWALRC